MKREMIFFLSIALLVFFLGMGHRASAEDESLVWEYWQENVPDTYI